MKRWVLGLIVFGLAFMAGLLATGCEVSGVVDVFVCVVEDSLPPAPRDSTVNCQPP